MAVRSRKTSPIVLVLITVVGLVLGSLLSLIVDTLLGLVPGEGGNVLGIFTWSVPVGFGFPEPYVLRLGEALKFNLGFELNVNIMSILGLWLSHKFYKSNQ